MTLIDLAGSGAQKKSSFRGRRPCIVSKRRPHLKTKAPASCGARRRSTAAKRNRSKSISSCRSIGRRPTPPIPTCSAWAPAPAPRRTAAGRLPARSGWFPPGLAVAARVCRRSITVSRIMPNRSKPCSRGDDQRRHALCGGTIRPAQTGLFGQTQSAPNKSRVNSLLSTPARSGLIRLARITSASALKASRSRTTRDPKNWSSASAGS